MATPSANAAAEIPEEAAESETGPISGAIPVALKVNGETRPIQIDT